MSYGNGAVSVDNNFARFGSKSYAINKINTVDVNVTRPHGWAPVLIFGFLAAVFLTAALGAAAQGAAMPFVVIGIVCAGITYLVWKKTKLRDYHLVLMTSSASAQAYTTRNAQEIEDLRSAIETAMMREQSVRHVHEFTMPPSHTPEPEVIMMKTAAPATFRQRVIGQS